MSWCQSGTERRTLLRDPGVGAADLRVAIDSCYRYARCRESTFGMRPRQISQRMRLRQQRLPAVGVEPLLSAAVHALDRAVHIQMIQGRRLTAGTTLVAHLECYPRQLVGGQRRVGPGRRESRVADRAEIPLFGREQAAPGAHRDAGVRRDEAPLPSGSRLRSLWGRRDRWRRLPRWRLRSSTPRRADLSGRARWCRKPGAAVDTKGGPLLQRKRTMRARCHGGTMSDSRC